MTDDFYKPNRPAAPPRQPKPGEPLWELRQDHETWSCELRFHGESYGWEAQILREGELFAGQWFVLRQNGRTMGRGGTADPRERARE